MAQPDERPASAEPGPSRVRGRLLSVRGRLLSVRGRLLSVRGGLRAARRAPASLVARDGTARQAVAGLRSAGPLRCTLAGIGAFAVTGGLLLRFYAAPALVVTPAGYYGTQVLTDPHATYFDQAKLVTRTNAPLSYVQTIRGDPSAATGSTVTWDSYAYIWNPKTGEQLDNSYQRAVINRRTGDLLDCCGAAVDDDPRVRQYGLAMTFPAGTRQATYQVYDVNTRRAWPAVFAGTATVQGILTYKFTQHIPATIVQKIPGISMSLLGVPGANYTVTANRAYQADATYWVDPRTGIPVDVEEKIQSALQDPAAIGSLTVVSADLKMVPSSQASLAAYSGQRAAAITRVRLTGPLTALIAGALLLLAAVFWPRRAVAGARRAAGSLARRAASRKSTPLSRTDHPVSPASPPEVLPVIRRSVL